MEGRAEVLRLHPHEPPVPTLGIDDDDAREALWIPVVDDATKPLRAPRWWAENHMEAWLEGSPVSAAEASSLHMHRRVQAHVGIRPDTFTADEGVLFSHDIVETLELDAEWAIGVEADLDGDPVPDACSIGSDARVARIEPLTPAMFEPPGDLTAAFRSGSPGLRLVVVSPADFAQGWCPDGFAAEGAVIRGHIPALDTELLMRAAMVPRPVHISGWDMAAGAPKRTSRMAPPGSVYFFERADGRPFTEADAEGLWLSTMGGRVAEGFGRVVPGTWFPRRIAP
jgi:CRISPR-associated protein Cmr3